MSDSTFHADLDALVRGESVGSDDELTRFVTDLYGEEQNVTMPNALKLRIANDLGLTQASEPTAIPAPVSRRTARAAQPPIQSSRPWAIGLGIAAAVLLVLTAVLRWGMPIGNDQPDSQFLLATPAAPTVAVSPEATPDWWMTPYTDADCPEDELIDRGEWISHQNELAAEYNPAASRQDAPYAMADVHDAETVVIRQRQAMACQNSQNMNALPIESPRRAWEWQIDAATDELMLVERIARSYQLSQWVESEMGINPAHLVHQAESDSGPIWEPNNAVQMADGRIALVPSWLSNSMDIQPFYAFVVPVWENVDGEWLLDEELFFCIGECDEYWEQLESGLPDATPIASPVSSPADDLAWLQPISADECTIEDIGQQSEPAIDDYDALVSREYIVIGPADPADSNAAVQAARIAMACDFAPDTTSEATSPFGFTPGDSFTPALPITLENQMQAGIAISTALEDQGLVPGDITINAGDNPAFADAEGPALLLPTPDHVIELEDGRLVIPMAAVNVNPAATAGPRSAPNAITIGLVMVWENDTWKVDDQIPLCIGVCTGIFSQFEQFAHDGSWLRPITIEECEANQLLPSQMTDPQAAATKSRQYRACELDGDASALQGPAFQVTEGPEAQTLSAEIEEAYSASGERAASLQRVADPFDVGIGLPEEIYQVFVPASAVELADGRVAVLETTVLSSDADNRVSIRTSPVVATALVWVIDDGSWVLDEEVTVCLGSCESFWNADEEIPATPVAQLLPETCDVDGDFAADFTSHPQMPVNLRPGPGNASGISVATISSKTPLQYLCESEETTNPTLDRMEEGQVWLKIRTEDGTEGWIREVDIREYEP